MVNKLLEYNLDNTVHFSFNYNHLTLQWFDLICAKKHKNDTIHKHG